VKQIFETHPAGDWEVDAFFGGQQLDDVFARKKRRDVDRQQVVLEINI